VRKISSISRYTYEKRTFSISVDLSFERNTRPQLHERVTGESYSLFCSTSVWGNISYKRTSIAIWLYLFSMRTKLLSIGGLKLLVIVIEEKKRTRA